MRHIRFRSGVRRKTIADSARLATCQRALRFERAIRASNGSDFRYIGHLRAFRNDDERDTCFRFRRNKKTAIPGWGRAVSRPVVPPHFLAWRTCEALYRTARGERCGDSITGVAWPCGHPSPPTWPIGRSERGSEVFFPGSSTPLHTNRGSLHPPIRVLVLLDALAFLDCVYAIKRGMELSRAEFRKWEMGNSRARSAIWYGPRKKGQRVYPPLSYFLYPSFTDDRPTSAIRSIGSMNHSVP